MAGEEENTPVENSVSVNADSHDVGERPDDGENNKDNNTLSQTGEQNTNDRLCQLPLSRIKGIMKSDPDVTLASQEAVVILAKATEMFITMISKDAINSTMQSKRKTLQRKDLDTVLDTRDAYAFLEGTLD